MWYYDKCKCCLKDGELKDMWSEYVTEGDTEIYGDMLITCFSLPWNERSDYMEKICESCIARLRDAYEFRREVVAAKELLDEWSAQNKKELKHLTYEEDLPEVQIEEEFKVETKEEEIVIEEYKQEVDDEVYENIDEDSQQESEDDKVYLEEISQVGSPEEVEMQVEYLEDDVEAEKAVHKRKWPKKKKKSEVLNPYKKYTRDDLEIAIEKVMSNKLTRAEASARYGVPIKTLGAKLRAKEMEDKQDDEAKKVQYQFFDEICKILTYTNATPYKTKVGKYFCAYCSTDGIYFRDPTELRSHTRTQHVNERLKSVEVFMRPYYSNEILKLDIENLLCTVCTIRIEDWNGMFKHLKEKHDVTLDLAYNRVIPFILQSDLRCALCHEKFPHYHVLDAHMNAHYSNYICGECGDTYLTKSRLNKHSETHSTQQFPCSDCGKVFTLEKYRKKHFDGVHLKEQKFKCQYCPKKFQGEYERHVHLVAKHKESLKIINCELCHMTFTWRPYYLKHLRLSHKKPEKKFKCKICSKNFLQKYELKYHLDWHKGSGFTCDVCDKKFSSKNYLQKHKLLHDTDTIYIVQNGREDIEETVD